MPKFHVQSTSEITDKKRFVMAGKVVEGQIQAGMIIHVPFNKLLDMTARIQSIEHGSDDVHLHFECELDEIELWRDLNISNEILEITKDDSRT